ncbi:MAG: tetratricopeptide repeat protein [Parafilimonas sp.]|nr:tetratricopeptide repeat protein [Parafilimonas sp.]
MISLVLLTIVAKSQPANNYIQKGNEAYRKADFDAAVENYKNALRKDPTNNTARFNLANALQKRNEIKEAQKNYDQVIEKSGVNSLKSESNYNKGIASLKEKDLQQAISSFKESLRENPSDDDARENLQKALNELKKQQQQNQPQNKNQQQQNPKQQKQPPLNKQMMQQKFNELRNQEKQLQQKLQNKNSTVQPDKDW